MRIRALLYTAAFFPACAVLGLPFPVPMAFAQNNAPNGQVQSGVDAWKAGDFDAAVRYWMPVANSGNADAQFNMGQAFKLGRGVVTSLADAEIWYRRAAEQGHLQAEDNLGLTLFTMGKREDAMVYIRRSAARGEARAQFLLGTAHYNGDLAEKDWPRAYALIHRASETGLSLAKSRILELDRLIPADQRNLGLAMLPAMRRAEEGERLAALPSNETPSAQPVPMPAPTAMARSAVAPPQPLQQVSLPPSQISASLDAATQPDVDDEPQAPPRPAAGVTFAAPPVNAATPAATTAQPVQQAAPQPTPAPTATPPRPAPAAPVAAPTRSAAPAAAPKSNTPPAAPTTSEGRWRAQLGSFSVPENARNMWKQASSKYSELRGKRPIYHLSGRYTRLLAEGFTSQADAAAFCAKVRADGGSCLVSSR